ncbi:MAG TPA: alpha/beta fold hydrolase [Kofleriaceae bacterium]|nr:alpha/beta fold hydrolase [Kofleriaceae bacterium]
MKAHVLSLLLFAACGDQAAKPSIALVHGAWETASAWDAVRARLTADGYTVAAIDLPGRPGNPLAPADATLAGYAQAVEAGIADLPRPVVLVGHSFGGFTISAVAEAQPADIQTLVYLAAFVPRDGASVLDLAMTDPASQVGAHLQVDPAAGLATIDASAGGAVFANDGTPAQQAAVAAALVPEPLAPLGMPAHVSATLAGFDKVYIKTLRDQAVTPAAQAAMIGSTTFRATLELDTGHSPFVTDPDGLTAAIEHAIER